MSRVTIFRSEVSYNSSLAWGGIRSGSGIGLLFADDVRGNCVCHGVRCQRLPSCVTKLRQNRRSYESRMVVIFYQNTSNLLCNSNTHWMVGYLWVAWLLCECYLWSFWSIFPLDLRGPETPLALCCRLCKLCGGETPPIALSIRFSIREIPMLRLQVWYCSICVVFV